MSFNLSVAVERTVFCCLLNHYQYFDNNDVGNHNVGKSAWGAMKSRELSGNFTGAWRVITLLLTSFDLLCFLHLVDCCYRFWL